MQQPLVHSALLVQVGWHMADAPENALQAEPAQHGPVSEPQAPPTAMHSPHAAASEQKLASPPRAGTQQLLSQSGPVVHDSPQYAASTHRPLLLPAESGKQQLLSQSAAVAHSLRQPLKSGFSDSRQDSSPQHGVLVQSSPCSVHCVPTLPAPPGPHTPTGPQIFWPPATSRQHPLPHWLSSLHG
jgi:hypothetical protein